MATEWYVKLGEQHIGPFSAKQLKKMAAAGQVTPQVSICRGQDGKPDGNWVLASKAKGLFADSNSSSQKSLEKNKNESLQASDGVGIPVADTTGKPHISKTEHNTRRKRHGRSSDINPADVLLVLFGLLLCFPLGLFVLWSRRWSINAKTITTFAWIFVVVIFAVLSQQIDYQGASNATSPIEVQSDRSSSSSPSASETGLTLRNYNRVRLGMSESEVKDILGYGYETTSENSFGQGEFKTETKLLTWTTFLKSAAIIFQKQGYQPEFTVSSKSQFNLD